MLITDANGVTRQSLAAAARQRGIPELNVPAEVVTVDKLPVLGTGKVDYQALQKLISEKVDA